ncbi:apolipoprotein C-I [Syngnathus scovelli]|uniref:apolipoprotein C-I n=1 Tax=Syngnathus scovelli TaxID=161590 RepID=UPI0035CC3F4C
MMKVYLAVAVLLLALIAYTDAQDETIEEKLSRYGDRVAETFKDMAANTKETFDNLGNSEFANSIKNWFKKQFGSN